MDLPAELAKIEQALLQNQIPAGRAAELIKKFRLKRGKPWAWKEWKEERPMIIGDRCRQCDDANGPFVLQHLHQVPRIDELVDHLWRSHPEFHARRSALRAKFTDAESSEAAAERPCCPSCGRTTIYQRKRTRDWACNKCRREFQNPAKTMSLTPEQKRQIATKKRQAFEASRHDYRSSAWDIVGRDGVLQWLALYREYLAFVHVATFCRKCAFLWDKAGRRRCRSCGTTYTLWLKTCSRCGVEAMTVEAMLGKAGRQG